MHKTKNDAFFSPKLVAAGQIKSNGVVHIFGYANQRRDRTRLDTVYLNATGPVTAIESLWVKLKTRTTLLLTPPEGTGMSLCHLRHGGLDRDKESSPFLRYQRRLPGLEWDNLILLDKRFSMEQENTSETSFLLNTPNAHLKLHERIHEIVDIALPLDWAARLAQLGYQKQLVKQLDGVGQKVLEVNLSKHRWERLVSAALREGLLTLNGSSHTGSEAKRTRQGRKTVGSPLRLEPPAVPSEDNILILPLVEKNEMNRVTFDLSHEGKWTWVSFSEKPSTMHRIALNQMGFCWSKKRKQWYATSTINRSEFEKILNSNTERKSDHG